MNQSNITITIDGVTYNLDPANADSINRLPIAQRQQLISLLEVIKQQSESNPQTVNTPERPSQVKAVNPFQDQDIANPERMGSGDIDALMARLIMEEQANEKPIPTGRGLYKFVIGVAVVTIILILVL